VPSLYRVNRHLRLVNSCGSSIHAYGRVASCSLAFCSPAPVFRATIAVVITGGKTDAAVLFDAERVPGAVEIARTRKHAGTVRKLGLCDASFRAVVVPAASAADDAGIGTDDVMVMVATGCA